MVDLPFQKMVMFIGSWLARLGCSLEGGMISVEPLESS
jgi:hypothetical protein